MVRPSRGSNEHVQMAVPSLVGEVNIVSPISAFVLNALIKCFFFPSYTEGKTVKFVFRNRPPILRECRINTREFNTKGT